MAVDITPQTVEIIPSKLKIEVPIEEMSFGAKISGWDIGSNELSKGRLRLQAVAERILLGSATEPLTGIGIFMGRDGSDYEFRIGDPSGTHMHFDGVTLTLKDIVIDGFGNARPSTSVIAASADTTNTVSVSSFTLSKEFKIKVAGDYNVFFEFRMTTGSGNVHGRIYKNGVAIGTDESTTSQTFISVNETISGLVVGDLLQLFAHITIDNGEVKNFRLRSSIAPDATVNTD